MTLLKSPGRQGLQNPGGRILGLVGPGHADGVDPIVDLVDEQHVQQFVRVNRRDQLECAAVDGVTFAGGALDEHPAHGPGCHR